MITNEIIKNWCCCENNEKAYFRPLICKGNLSKADIFLVGINPATSIMQKDLTADEYIGLLCDYDKFLNYYKNGRIIKGKRELSRTRLGMNSFTTWLTDITNSSVIETNIITYPTDNINKLRTEPREIIERSKAIFFEVMLDIKPQLIILHGKKTVELFIELLPKHGIEFSNTINLNKKICEMEAEVPFITFNYLNGSTCLVVVCRHLMYYGNNGNSYAKFKENIKNLVTKTKNEV